MKSFPFDSEVTYDEDGMPQYDRGSKSADLREYLSLLYSDGVFPDPSTNLQVIAATQEMSVTVLPGNINIQGALGIEDTSRTLVFEAAGKNYDRIDAVVARLNTNHDYRKIDLYVIKGTEASAPIAPALTRMGGIYELRLANVFIAKNTTNISGERITDTRLIKEDCGIVTANPQTVDTTSIFNQYQSALNKYMSFVQECISGTTEDEIRTEISEINESLNNLTQSGTITEVKVVTALPADAASHKTTLYLVKE